MQEITSLQLHGTGTPLGDPIEMGAAVGTLRPIAAPASAQPLSLEACKTAFGHTEPAAGVMGAVHAVLALSAQEAMPLLHLRQVPHLCSSFLQLQHPAGLFNGQSVIVVRTGMEYCPESAQEFMPRS